MARPEGPRAASTSSSRPATFETHYRFGNGSVQTRYRSGNVQSTTHYYPRPKHAHSGCDKNGQRTEFIYGLNVDLTKVLHLIREQRTSFERCQKMNTARHVSDAIPWRYSIITSGKKLSAYLRK